MFRAPFYTLSTCIDIMLVYEKIQIYTKANNIFTKKSANFISLLFFLIIQKKNFLITQVNYGGVLFVWKSPFYVWESLFHVCESTTPMFRMDLRKLRDTIISSL